MERLSLSLVIDAGNTRIKTATFLKAQLIEKKNFDSADQAIHTLKKADYENVIISSVRDATDELFKDIQPKNKKLIASVNLSLPVSLSYATPATLGFDRIAAACGALEIFPSRDCLVIDAGTCINYEFLDKTGVYHGGAISPGIHMRFKAMHTFTQRLPLVQAISDVELTGASTEACLQSGVVNGVRAEVDGIIDLYKEKYPDIGLILCGGDGPFFENKLKHSIFAAPDLVLSGLNRILLHNV
jgi:type III pantothenate kinase